MGSTTDGTRGSGLTMICEEFWMPVKSDHWKRSKSHVPCALQISAVLALACGANWAAFDGTRTGIILGALLAVGAPLSEAFIVNVLGWWHYDRPDFLGVVHWSGALAFQLIVTRATEELHM